MTRCPPSAVPAIRPANVVSMARRPRIFEPGAYYHVAARGNNGEPIVRDDLDRLDFLRWLSRIVSENRWRVITYCLMTNHYHLAHESNRGGLRQGHAAPELRPRSQDESQAWTHRSPVSEPLLLVADRERRASPRGRSLHRAEPGRAGICTKPEQWPWSSYRAAVDLEHPSDFLALGDLLGIFGTNPARARVAFRDFVAAGNVQVSDTWTWDNVT